MAAIEWDDVTALQANLSTVAPKAQAMFLAYVNEDLSPAAFGGEGSQRYKMARCFLAAHLGELERRKGERAVASEAYGTSSVSIAYGTSDESLKQTSWGAEYAALLEASPMRLGVF